MSADSPIIPLRANAKDRKDIAFIRMHRGGSVADVLREGIRLQREQIEKQLKKQG